MCVALVHREADAEVRIVVEVCARGNDPINKSGFDEWNQSGDTETSRCKCTGQGKTYRNFRFKHLSGEQLAGFAQPGGVVGKKGFVDQVGNLHRFTDRSRIDTSSLQKLTLMLSHLFFSSTPTR